MPRGQTMITHSNKKDSVWISNAFMGLLSQLGLTPEHDPDPAMDKSQEFWDSLVENPHRFDGLLRERGLLPEPSNLEDVKGQTQAIPYAGPLKPQVDDEESSVVLMDQQADTVDEAADQVVKQAEMQVAPAEKAPILIPDSQPIQELKVPSKREQALAKEAQQALQMAEYWRKQAVETQAALEKMAPQPAPELSHEVTTADPWAGEQVQKPKYSKPQVVIKQEHQIEPVRPAVKRAVADPKVQVIFTIPGYGQIRTKVHRVKTTETLFMTFVDTRCDRDTYIPPSMPWVEAMKPSVQPLEVFMPQTQERLGVLHIEGFNFTLEEESLEVIIYLVVSSDVDRDISEQESAEAGRRGAMLPPDVVEM